MIDVRRSPIDVAAVVDRVRRDDAGAIVVFLGSVRADAGVRALDYEVYEPMARKALQDLAEHAKSKFGLLEVAIVHRMGRIPEQRQTTAGPSAQRVPIVKAPTEGVCDVCNDRSDHRIERCKFARERARIARRGP